MSSLPSFPSFFFFLLLPLNEHLIARARSTPEIDTNLLQNEHKESCRWQGRPSPVHFTTPPLVSPSDFQRTVISFLRLPFLPSIQESVLSNIHLTPALTEYTSSAVNARDESLNPHPDSDFFHAAMVLSLTGWIPTSETSYFCRLCQRTLPPQSFTPCEKRGFAEGTRQEEEEGVGKEDAIERSGDSDPTLEEGEAVWKRRRIIGSLNPLTEHRWFCPYEKNLDLLAERIQSLSPLASRLDAAETSRDENGLNVDDADEDEASDSVGAQVPLVLFVH